MRFENEMTTTTALMNVSFDIENWKEAYTKQNMAYLNGCNMQHATSNYLKHFFFGFHTSIIFNVYFTQLRKKTKSHANQAKIIEWNGWCRLFSSWCIKTISGKSQKNNLFEVKWKRIWFITKFRNWKGQKKMTIVQR